MLRAKQILLSQPLRGLVMPLTVGILWAAASAQQSYRSYQPPTDHVLPDFNQPGRKMSDTLPMRFKGWKRPDKSAAKYAAHFSRPRARASHAELLQNVARKAARQKSSFASAQFSPSQRPGFLLRDSLPAGFIPTSVATGDFNGDGKLDFVVANGGDNSLWLYFGKGDGTFSLPIILPVTLGMAPTWVATADLRGIGRTDLVVAEADSNSVGIFLGNGDGTFAESAVPLPGAATFLLVGDFNGDRKLDVVAPMDDGGDTYIAMLPGLGNGTFGPPVNTPDTMYAPLIFWASSADLNGDGYPDLVLSSFGIDEIAIQVFLNDGKGSFTAGQVVGQDSAGDTYLGSVLLDADGDGITDALVADSNGELWVFHGNGDGTFNISNASSFPVGDISNGVAAADVNGDGHLDVIVAGVYVDDSAIYGTEAGDQISVLEGDGKGNFSAPRIYRGDSSSYALAVGDFNGDGHPDVVTANQDNDSATVFLNDGQGGYGVPAGNWIGYEGALGTAFNAPLSDVEFADVNGDRSNDVAFLEWNQLPDTNYQLTVLLNDGNGNLSSPIRSDAISTNYGAPGHWVLADFRNTGHPDFLAITPSYANANYISFAPNAGGGRFGPLTATSSPNAIGAIGVGDFNHDGNLDFVAAGYGMNNASDIGIQVFLGNGDGTFKVGYTQIFGSTSEPIPAAVYVGDFNRDGKLDLLVFLDDNGGFVANADLYEFLGNGDGTFQTGKLLIPNVGPMVVADVNGDGYPDIVAMLQPINDPYLNPVQFSIFIGQPDGTFKLTNVYTPYTGGASYPDFVPTDSTFSPMVADFNGDGIPDIAAFQQTGNNNLDTYVQIMLGNGDGTFTPTYDVFDFRKPNVTAFAADLTGDGKSELFELNSYRSTYNLLPTVVAPTFQISLLEEPIPGRQSSGIILLDAASSTPTTVSLTTSDPAITVPANVTIPAGSVSTTFGVSIGSSFTTNHVFSITAQQGSTSAIAYGFVVASGVAGFQATVGGGLSWPNVDLVAGQSEENFAVSATSVNGLATTLSVQCTGISSVAQCVVPSSLYLRAGDYANGPMSITVNSNAAQGVYPGNVQVSDGVSVQNFPFTLNVGDFTMSLSPQTLQVVSNGNGSYQLTIGSVNQFNQAVNLTCGGLPAGATCSVTPFAYPPTGATPVSVGVQTQSVAPGNYQITVTGTSSPLSHSATAQLQVSGFLAAVSPTTATVSAGGSTNFTVTVSPVNGFSGSVSFSCSTSGPVTYSFNPPSVSVPASGTGTSVLTLTASSQSRQLHVGRGIRPGVAASTLGLAIWLFLFTNPKRRMPALAVLLLSLGLCGLPSCGGGSSSGGKPQSQTYTIIVQATVGSGTAQPVGTILLTVN